MSLKAREMANKKPRKPRVKQPWEGADVVDVRLLVPGPFRMLAALLELDISHMLLRFMEDLFSSKQKEQWMMVGDYFLVSRQGQSYYTAADVRQMIEELSGIEGLFPRNADMKVIEAHARWRDVYYQYWFEKWRAEVRRRASS